MKGGWEGVKGGGESERGRERSERWRGAQHISLQDSKNSLISLHGDF